MTEARRSALVRIVAAVARSGGAADVGQMVRDLDLALREAGGEFSGPGAEQTGTVPPRRVGSPSASPREMGKRWPFAAPAHPADIQHSLGDGTRLRCFETGLWTRDLEPVLARRGMTPEQYRRKWGLPPDYPMQSQAEMLARAARMPWEGRMPTPKEVKASITPSWLVSFEDGARYKSLTRHIAARGMSPQGYRQKWGLPRDYPMTAPNVKATRQEHGRWLASNYRRTSAVGSNRTKPTPDR